MKYLIGKKVFLENGKTYVPIENPAYDNYCKECALSGPRRSEGAFALCASCDCVEVGYHWLDVTGLLERGDMTAAVVAVRESEEKGLYFTRSMANHWLAANLGIISTLVYSTIGGDIEETRVHNTQSHFMSMDLERIEADAY